MTRTLISKLIEGVITVWGAVTIVFVLSRSLGDPAALLLPLGAGPDQVAQLRQSLGLDASLLIQYGRFIGAALRGDFGQSYQFSRPALQVVFNRMPASLLLTAAGMTIGLALGVGAGCTAVARRGSLLRAVVAAAVLIGQASPIFWVGVLLILYFSIHLGLLPPGGFDSWSALVLPALAIAIYCAANIARLFASSLSEVIGEDYVRTARAKGLRPAMVFLRHILRNALVPLAAMCAILAAEILGGSVITESVFSWPGVGTLIVQAIGVHDFPVVQAAVAVLATIVVAINIATDVLYTLLDPKLRTGA